MPTKPLKPRRLLDSESKQRLTVQLCGLLRSGIECLKGGQSLQYTSLLLINKIIDTIIVYEVSGYPIECNETHFVLKDNPIDKDSKSKTKSSAEGTGGKAKEQTITQMPSVVTNENNRPVITSLKTTTMSSSFKENLRPDGTVSSSSTYKTNRQSKSQKSWSHKSWSKWIRGKTVSMATSSVKRLGTVKKAGSSSNLQANAGAGSFGGKHILHESTARVNVTLLSILVGEGIDLILNVLNNAITLHKRVTGSKQCCTPSHR